MRKPKQALAQPRKSLVAVPAIGPLAGRTIYANSWALLIGVNKYPYLPPDLSLHYAVKDVNDLRDELVRDYGFAPGHITVLTEGLATRQRIADALDDLTDSGHIGENDRVLVYFSGHGQTVNTPLGGDLGFLVPEDAKVDLDRPNNIGPYNRSCLSMSWLRDTLQSCPAKHVLILADACYSGLLAQSRAPEALNTSVVAEMATLRARQVMTAGTKGQTSQELGEYGHGAFTYKLIEQLKARAAVKGNIFTASDLFVSLRASVSNLTNSAQLPQLASFGTEGDFLFITAGAPDVKPSVPASVVREATTAPTTGAKDGEIGDGSEIISVTDVLSLTPPRTIAEYKAQMAYIPGGTFQMGSNEGEDNEKPVHQVTLSSFKMGRTPVTVAMWKEFCEATGKSMPPPPDSEWIDDHPIVNVNWRDAIDYCAWAGLALPTEAEWEYAAKGGLNVKYLWGDTYVPSNLISGTNADHKSLPSVIRRDRVFVNRFGLVDMAGFTWQWCSDQFGPYSEGAEKDPTGPGVGRRGPRVLRGGSWSSHGIGDFRTSYRTMRPPTYAWLDLGLRCVERQRADVLPNRTPTLAMSAIVSSSREIVHPVSDPLNMPAPRTIAEYKAQMASIPGGTFQMGSDTGKDNEKPVHQVSLSPFKLGRTPVTVAMWKEYCQAAGKSMPVAPDWGWIDDHPIINVSWDEATAYCTWAGLVLPTEAQWEYAAKSGQNVEYPWGNVFNGDLLVNKSNASGRTAPVVRHDRVFVNPFGILDMAGSVRQWCSDYYGPYTKNAQRDPSGSASSGDSIGRHVLRGGSFDLYTPEFSRASNRSGGISSRSKFGFRCASPVLP